MKFEYLGIAVGLILVYFMSEGECLVAEAKRRVCYSPEYCVQGVKFCNSLSIYKTCQSCSQIPDYCSYPNKSEQCLLVACMQNAKQGLEHEIKNLTAAMNNKDEEHKEINTRLKGTVSQLENELKKKNETISAKEEKLQTFKILFGVAIICLVLLLVVLLVLLAKVYTARRMCQKDCDDEVPDSPNIKVFVPSTNTILKEETKQCLLYDQTDTEQLIKSEGLHTKMQTEPKQFRASSNAVPSAPPADDGSESQSTPQAPTTSPGAPSEQATSAALASVIYKNCHINIGNTSTNCDNSASNVVRSPITNSNVGNRLAGPNQLEVPEVIPAETGDLPSQTSEPEKRHFPWTQEARGHPVQDTEPPKQHLDF